MPASCETIHACMPLLSHAEARPSLGPASRLPPGVEPFFRTGDGPPTRNLDDIAKRDKVKELRVGRGEPMFHGVDKYYICL